MARFLIRRILLGLFTMFLVTLGTFFLFFSGSGPKAVAQRLAGRQATPQVVALIQKRLQLDDPLYLQYLHFLGRLLHGDLGTDYYYGYPVTTALKQDFPVTLSLVFGAAILWLAMGVLTGVVSAVRTRSLWDRSLTTMALVFYSMPTFVLGFILILVFYKDLTVNGIAFFPQPGIYTGISQDPATWFRTMLLPWFTLALVQAATYTRLTRGSMLDVSGEDFIRTARSKGMRERRVIFVHTLRAALTPVVTQFGIDVGTLLGGVIITETVFGLPGLGWAAIKSIGNQDLPLIVGIVIVASAAVVVSNIVVDAFYAVLDPRVRLH